MIRNLWALALAVLLTAKPTAAAVSEAGTIPAAKSPNASPVTQVIIVFKTHFDIGYTDMASNVVRRYRTTMIDEALKVVDRNRDLPPAQQFVWTLPGWPMKTITEDWDGQTPERKQKILQAYHEGRFVTHALPFSMHTELLEPEDLVRGLGFASRLARAAGLELPRDAKMTDVPCHSWIMPTLLHNAGVDFLHLGCNAASSSPQVPTLFWWEGPDGSRLLTMYSASGYGTSLVPPTDWPYRTWLALIHTGDNHGPPTPEEVKKVLEEAKQKLPGVNVRIGRLSDFADAILADAGTPVGGVARRPEQNDARAGGARPSGLTSIPVVRGDMPDTWIHGPMSDPQGAKLARNLRPSIFVAESLNTLLGAWGVKVPDISDTVARAYEQSLLYGEHTWGGAQYWVTQYGAGTQWGYGDVWKTDRAKGRFQRLEDSWAEHTAYIETARDLILPKQQAQLQRLAESVNVSGRRVVVLNPLPWPRDGFVTLPADLGAAQTLQAVDTGEIIPLEKRSGISFVARQVPALGYRTFIPADRRVTPPIPTYRPGSDSFENSFFKVRFDATHGTLRSLVDKRAGRELVLATPLLGLGQFTYEHFDSNNVAAYVKAYVKIKAEWAVNELGKPSLPPAREAPYDCPVLDGFQAVVLESAVSSRVRFERADPDDLRWQKLTTEFILYRDLPFADLEFTITGKQPDPWPEAGWLRLPFRLDAPRYRLGRQSSIIDPLHDIVAGANRNLFGLGTGAALFDSAGHGVGLCPIDSPLLSLEIPGCWQYSTDFEPDEPVVYVNLFNNQWTTNFRMWNQGTWTSRVRLWSFDRYDAETALITPSLEARFPLAAAVADGASGQLPATQAGVELSRKGVLVTAFGANPDGQGTVLRLWEMAGISSNCTIRLPAGLDAKTVQPVNLRGQPSGKRMAINQRAFEVPLRAFAPASLVIDSPARQER